MSVDPAFFSTRGGPFTLQEIAEALGLTPEAGDLSMAFTSVASLDRAGPQDVSFLDNPKYKDLAQATRAGAVILAPKFKDLLPPHTARLVTSTPYKAFARLAQMFFPPEPIRAGVHPSASVDPTAKLGEGIEIGPGVVIAAGASVGARTRIAANSVIEKGVQIGADCRIGPLCVISHAHVGDRVTLHPGVKIGQDGFGFAPDSQGHVKMPQLGRVLIGDGCDIGANTTIDRGAGPDTVIGPGCWIDNLVQIGHNVQIGRGSIIVAQSGIAGSTRLGDFVTLGAQAGIAGHLTIGPGARIAAQSGVMNNIEAGETVVGAPAQPAKSFFRQVAILQKMAGSKGNPKKDEEGS